MKLNFLLLLLLVFSTVEAQNNNKSGVVKYQKTYYPFDSLEHGGIDEEALLFNETEATYFYIKFIRSIESPDLKAPDAAPITNVYNNFSKKTITSAIRTPAGSYIVQEDMKPLTWYMLNKTKKIQNIECFSAQTEYRGRVWTAWYAPSIPISSGPWKLYGLPGMILEAEDRKGLIKYECLSVVIPASGDLKMGKPTPKKQINQIPISIKDFAIACEKDIMNAEKMSIRREKDGMSGSSRQYHVNDIEIFDFEKNITLKRFQQKLSDTPKK